jgi:Kef-type K+ transport system membrane component KefB
VVHSSTEHIFPFPWRSYLSCLVANIGLGLFLSLVGLEIDAEVIKRNARLSTTVAFAYVILPFGIGAGMVYTVYQEFISPEIVFINFMLFHRRGIFDHFFPCPRPHSDRGEAP